MESTQAQEVTTTIKPLLQILSDKVLPWAGDTPQSRCIVATPTLRDLHSSESTLPENIQVSARTRQGKRIRVPKSQQRVGSVNSKMATYVWPEDGLLCKRDPQLACIVSGHCDFRVGNYILHVPAGNFIIIPPGVPYPDGSRGHVEGTGSCDILWLTLWGDVLRCWMCHSRDQEHLPVNNGESCFIQEAQASAYLLALAEEAAGREAGYQVVCNSLLLALWTVLYRRINQGQFFQNLIFTVEDEGPLKNANAPILLAQQYIRTHLHDHLTIASVAQRVYLSRSQFARRFHEETGQTFTEFITECRIEQASKLLVDTEWPLSTIGELTGVTPAHLREIFHRHRGQSPLEFRKSQRKASFGTKEGT